ncbi:MULTISPECIES: Trk system potassium transporter TrkA [Haloferax]|uniref:Trk system potassium transporter TrkA n=1 Tax=Haloferax marinum TaxID=2666143 RepID=A0A6A8G463_9EURY|nr:MULTISPECIES: Trk system potassium transporter TrkA [Haloferax]KAB1196721.1 Trk system potassium transporter TrkA [Haloferax sp. CBA1150]MRW95729.1 Trk system potassium transporter TrkA [Haloferax marinum]
MRVVIVGAGEVGSNIASSLADAHDVVVVDVDADRVEELNYSLDVLAIQGDGASIETLEEAGVGDADLLIASTDHDETNLATCGTSKVLGEAFTIARVKQVGFLRTWERTSSAFGVDFMVCSNLLTAEDIVQIIGLPAAVDVEWFANGLVQMAEFELGPDSPLVGQTVSEADQFEFLTFAAVLRNGDVELARGDSTLAAGERVVVIGPPERVHQFALTASPAAASDDTESVFVVGGGEIGYQTARLLQERGINPRLIEEDPERAREVAESLSKTLVLQFDATDTDALERENFDSADAVVAALESDQENLLVSLLAKRLGVKQTIAVVETGEYRDVFEAVGVDVAVNPRVVTAEEITRITREETTEKLTFIEDDRAEVIEVEVSPDSALAGVPIRESIPKLPAGVVVGAIARQRDLVSPRGDTVIEVGDHVVLFVDAAIAEEITAAI